MVHQRVFGLERTTFGDLDLIFVLFGIRAMCAYEYLYGQQTMPQLKHCQRFPVTVCLPLEFRRELELGKHNMRVTQHDTQEESRAHLGEVERHHAFVKWMAQCIYAEAHSNQPARPVSRNYGVY